MEFTANLMTTGIGSVPHADGDDAAAFVLDAGLSIPFWPQLPRRGFLEQMIAQYSDGMPCLSTDLEEKKLSFDTGAKQDCLMGFYERFLEEDPELFPLTEEYAQGFHAFARACETRECSVAKGHVTGPITFTTGIVDGNRNALYADPELRDAAVKLLARKAEWQIGRLKKIAPEGVVLFVDEPVLSAFGSSAYLGISEDDVHALDGELFRAIADAGGTSGVHVCGNSDWGVVIRAGVAVVNFDAYQYGTRIALYSDDVKGLFDRGGCVAWGIVPTTDAIEEVTLDSLTARFEECLGAMREAGFDEELVKERSLLTPSCGAGNLDLEKTEKVFRLLRELRDRLSQ